MTLPEQLIVFPGAKIDGRRVKVNRQAGSGQALGVTGFLSGPLQGAPEEAAYEFLKTNHRLFKSSGEILRELQVEQVSRSPAGYHVTFRQVHEGLPVEETRVSVHLTRDKRVHAAHMRLSPSVTKLDVQSMAKDGINRDEAICIAVERLKADQAKVPVIRAEQVIVTDREPTVAWRVSLSDRQSQSEWLVWVDASSGRVLRQRQVGLE